MRKIAIVLISIMLFMVVGCSNSKKDVVKYNYTYKGENDLWTAEYKVNHKGEFIKKDGVLHYESDYHNVLTVTYKKDISELSSVKCLKISYKSSTGGRENILNFTDGSPNEKTYTFNSSGKGGVAETKDEIIQVNISIDGKNQVIELKNIQ